MTSNRGIAVAFVVCCVLSFLVGGIPFGYLVGRFVLKDDIRNHGSGNIGATNVGRVIGWKWGGFVLVLDAVKGLAPTGAAMIYASRHMPESMHLHLPVAAGICAVMGHMYPIYLKLRGGKGVATALGVVIVLAPKAVCVALAVFVVALAATRMVALASILAATTFGVTKLIFLGEEAFQTHALSVTAFSIAVPLLIIWRHRSNIARMLAGNEPTMSDRAGQKDETDDPVSDSALANPASEQTD